MDSGVVLPMWHCAFASCREVSRKGGTDTKHEQTLWQHIWSGDHKDVLYAIIRKFDLKRADADLEETAFTLYSNSLLEKERESIPLLGLSTDRRTLQHVGEVFREDNVQIYMCFT